MPSPGGAGGGRSRPSGFIGLGRTGLGLCPPSFVSGIPSPEAEAAAAVAKEAALSSAPSSKYQLLCPNQDLDDNGNCGEAKESEEPIER